MQLKHTSSEDWLSKHHKGIITEMLVSVENDEASRPKDVEFSGSSADEFT